MFVESESYSLSLIKRVDRYNSKYGVYFGSSFVNPYKLDSSGVSMIRSPNQNRLLVDLIAAAGLLSQGEVQQLRCCCRRSELAIATAALPEVVVPLAAALPEAVPEPALELAVAPPVDAGEDVPILVGDLLNWEEEEGLQAWIAFLIAGEAADSEESTPTRAADSEDSSLSKFDPSSPASPQAFL